MSDEARKAAAYLNLVLVNDKDKLWPDDIRDIKAAIAILGGICG